MKRRSFLGMVASGALGALLGTSRSAWAAPPGAGAASKDEFFVFVHAAGGWDVTVGLDPRNEKKGIIMPASTDTIDTAPIKRWVDAPLDDGTRTFAPVRAPGSSMVFGPAIGDLLDLHDRITVINGLAMNTVSHPDGSAFSATGRHLVGGRSPTASIDVCCANEFGADQLFPVVSVQFPSFYVGDKLDKRCVPLVVGQIGSLSKTITRSSAYDLDADRDAVTALLADEARDLANRSEWSGTANRLALQYESLRRMLGSHLQDAFGEAGLRKAYPDFNYKGRFQGNAAIEAAFAVEAMKRNVVRAVSFAAVGFDTHSTNYKQQPLVQQELFDLIAMMVKYMDATPHPTRAGAKLSDHVHILVVSDFCRTPQINLAGGRDHYPNNSALVVSPRFKGGFTFGASDPEQLLPARAKRFAEGDRPIAPPDLLATFLSAFGVDPRLYLRDGEAVPELLRGAHA